MVVADAAGGWGFVGAGVMRKLAQDGGMFASVVTEDIRDLAPRSLFAEAAE